MNDAEHIIEEIEKSHQAMAASVSVYGDQTKRLQIRFDEVTEKLDDIKTTLKEDFVTKDQFWPVKTLVYSAVGIILTAVLIAGIALIVDVSSSKIVNADAIKTL